MIHSIPELPDSKKGGDHWPNHFNRIAEEIKSLDHGTIVLVAAGILGKVYCAQAKAAGLYAIDIGAIADWFCNNKTRRIFNDKNYGSEFLI